MMILVTGAAGFAGAHICEELIEGGHSVVALVSFKHRGCPLRLETIKDRLDRIVYHDLRAPISDRVAAWVGHVDVVIHAAAESHVGLSEVSNMAMVDLIEGFTGREIRKDVVDFHASRPGHDARYALDSSKIRAAGWVQPGHFQYDLRETVEWTMNHPLWWE